jgi:hypothetical protein
VLLPSTDISVEVRRREDLRAKGVVGSSSEPTLRTPFCVTGLVNGLGFGLALGLGGGLTGDAGFDNAKLDCQQ